MAKTVAWAALAVVLAGSAALYLTRLSSAPPYLMHDEVNFSLQAHAIATTGRDTNGRLLPVYFSETGFEAGRDPLMIYWTAGLLAVQPLSDTTVRLPTAFLAVLSIGLMFIAARRLVGDSAALVGALLLALTPGYFTNARLALSITYGIPIVLLCLCCIERASEKERRWWLVSGVCLGLGLYAYLANMILMPALLLVAVALLWQQGQRREARLMVAGFALLLLPLAGWLVLHPDRFTNIIAAYRPTGGGGVMLRERITAFWMFFNPDYLFVSGDSRITNSTRAAGLFPLAFIILIPVGLYRLTSRDNGLVGRLVLAGFLIAPVASAVSGRLDINRILIAIPFGVLAATAGAADLLSRRGIGRVVAVVLLFSVALQFVGFYRHYHGDYRVAAGAWFGGDNRAAVNAVIDRVTPDTPRIYLDIGTPIERYWRFYAAARGRADLAETPTYYDPNRPNLSEAPAGSLLVCESAHRACTGVDGAGWKLVSSVSSVGDSITHRVYEKGR